MTDGGQEQFADLDGDSLARWLGENAALEGAIEKVVKFSGG